MSSVYHYLDSIFFCFPYDLIQGICRSKCIGNMAKRKNLACRVFQVGGKGFPIQRSVGKNRNRQNSSPGFLSGQLPRDDVGMVFHLGQNDAIPASQSGLSVTVGHEVEGFGRSSREDKLLGVDREPAGNGFACLSVFVFGFLRQLIYTTVDIRVCLLVKAGNRVDYAFRFL